MSGGLGWQVVAKLGRSDPPSAKHSDGPTPLGETINGPTRNDNNLVSAYP